MKKLIALVLTLACVSGMAGCGRSMGNIIENEPSVTGVVEEVRENSIIIYCEQMEGYPHGARCDVSLNVENEDSYTDVSVGDEVVVYHNGDIAESDPLQINTVYAITLKTPAGREESAVSEKCQNDAAGTVTFYAEPVEEAQRSKAAVTVRCCVELSGEQADRVKAIIDNVDEWVDDHTVDRLAYYFDGDFELSDREFVYYFTYEYNVIYYDHYFAEIPAEDMQFIRDIAPEEADNVVSIVDRTKEEGLTYATAVEKFFEDEENEYFFGGIYSHYVIVEYADGSQKTVKEALELGEITIDDLDRFDIAYFTEPKGSAAAY